MTHYTDDLSFGDISSGYGGNVQSSGNIMEYIFNMLKTGGYEGFAGTDDEDPYDWYGEGGFGTTGQTEGYGLQDWMGYLNPESSSYGGWGEDSAGGKMAERLSSVLSKLNIPGLMQGYGEDVGGVSAEIGSQANLLKKGLTTAGKGGRYGVLGGGGRLKGGGGRQAYLSDYYGLQQKEREMTTGLQTGVESDINRMMMDYMASHPST